MINDYRLKIKDLRLSTLVSVLILGLTITYHLFPIPSFAHFVKSEHGIGAVLHVDPGDDPVAGEQSNIILEFKDTNSKFNLSNCDCKIAVFEGDKEIINQDLGAVAADQSLSSVTPVTFPEKDIYKLKVSGNSKDGSYGAFELQWDIRVAKAREQEVVSEEKQSNWWLAHLIHLIGGFVVVGFLIFALIAQNRKKVAVIILALLILGHSVPIKAIHAAHNGPVDSGAYVCCLPTAAILPGLPEIEAEVVFYITQVEAPILNFKFEISNSLTIRPPPLS